MWDTCTSHYGRKFVDQVGRGVREGQNMAQNAPYAIKKMAQIWLWSPLETPKWVRDPENGLKPIRGSWGDNLGSFLFI